MTGQTYQQNKVYGPNAAAKMELDSNRAIAAGRLQTNLAIDQYNYGAQRQIVGQTLDAQTQLADNVAAIQSAAQGVQHSVLDSQILYQVALINDGKRNRRLTPINTELSLPSAFNLSSSAVPFFSYNVVTGITARFQ